MAITTTKDFDEMQELSNKLKEIKSKKDHIDDFKGRLKTDIAELKAVTGYTTKVTKADRDEIELILAEIQDTE